MMAVLECIKPGAKTGQILLVVDLSIAGSPDEVLAKLEQLGYEPEIRHITYPSGIHVLAILKDEQHESTVDDNYLLEEWQRLISHVNSDAVHLWRGK